MRTLRYIFLTIGILLWGAGLSSTVSHWLYEVGVIVDDYRYGDLYRLAPLPQFKTPYVKCATENRASDTSSTHLYIIGDSFTEPQRLAKSDFGVSHYERIAWGFDQTIQLNPGKRNLLLIESVERHVREHFMQPVREYIVTDDTSRMAKPTPSLAERIANDYHRTDVEQRLESALFSHDWAFWFKELKAKLTLDWFDRVYPTVSLSSDKHHIFMESDTDTTQAKRLNSSFSTITNQEIATLVDSLNVTATYYKQLGFDEVYLSIIPNKASILEPNQQAYNHLIERVQNHPNLRVPLVNTYQVYRRKTNGVYLKSDTHWTCEGREIWLSLVRSALCI